MRPVTQKCNITPMDAWLMEATADSPDANRLGGFLRALRQERNLGLGEAAQAAGVHRATLYRWEQGETQPRLTELEALLHTLSASETQKRQALIRMDAARARIQVRAAFASLSAQAGIGPMPDGGDLLQAMRLRRSLSREDVAAQVGVSTRTLRRWEEGDVWPPADRLHALCFALNAHPDEVFALTVGRFAPTANRFAVPGESLVELGSRFEEFQIAAWPSRHPEEEALKDLRFLAFEAQAWTLAARDASACGLLSHIYSLHAYYCTQWGRFHEAMEKAERALEIGSAVRLPAEQLARAGIIGAYGRVYRGERPAPKRGLERLQSWLDTDLSVVYRAWLLADVAQYLAMDGQNESAREIAAHATHLSEEIGDIELALRCMDEAKVLLRAGRPGSAVRILSDALTYPFPRIRVRAVFLLAEALQMAGDAEGARGLANQMLTEMEAIDSEPHNWDPLRAQARALLQGLSI